MRAQSCSNAGGSLSTARRLLFAIACATLATNLPSPLYGQDITRSGAKAGHAWGAAARGFDDANGRQVHLPHDWAVEQPFDPKAVKQQGYRQRGIGWPTAGSQAASTVEEVEEGSQQRSTVPRARDHEVGDDRPARLQ